jgi:hypothetical protein
MQNFFSKLFWKLKPVLDFIDKAFTIPFSIKKITGDHYYEWRDKIVPGTVFLTNTQGVGSNLINPSELKHGAIYFGKNLKTAINKFIDAFNHSYNQHKDPKDLEKIDRLHKFLLENKISDDICYVIEALGKGVTATNLVKFLTTKDKLLIIKPKFADNYEMRKVATTTAVWLGLPYDYGFNHDETSKYCFEVVADAYSIHYPGIKLKQTQWHFFSKKLFECYLAETFLDENWEVIIDSENYTK